MDYTTEALKRIEAKLDILIAALAAEDEHDEPNVSLDGQLFPGERDQSQAL